MEARTARKLFDVDCLLVGLGCSLTLSMVAGGVTTSYFNKEKFIAAGTEKDVCLLIDVCLFIAWRKGNEM